MSSSSSVQVFRSSSLVFGVNQDGHGLRAPLTRIKQPQPPATEGVQRLQLRPFQQGVQPLQDRCRCVQPSRLLLLLPAHRRRRLLVPSCERIHPLGEAHLAARWAAEIGSWNTGTVAAAFVAFVAHTAHAAAAVVAAEADHMGPAVHTGPVEATPFAVRPGTLVAARLEAAAGRRAADRMAAAAAAARIVAGRIAVRRAAVALPASVQAAAAGTATRTAVLAQEEKKDEECTLRSFLRLLRRLHLLLLPRLPSDDAVHDWTLVQSPRPF